MGMTGTDAATASALADIDERGYTVIVDALDAATLARFRAELAPLLGTGPLGRNIFEGRRTNRVYALIAKAPTCAELVEHPAVLAIVDRLLQPNPLLTACQAINLQPGQPEQPLHYDDAFYPIPRPRPPVSISTIWAIDDFTAANGATEVIPGSHRWADGEQPEEEDARLVPVEMAAGSVVVFSGCLWHRGGANRTDVARCAVSPQYCQPWARTQEQLMLAVGQAAARMSPRIRSMLGYSIHPPFMGHVDGVHPERLLDGGYDANASGAGLKARRFWEPDA